MRSTNSIKNAVVAFLMNLVTILVGFISQRIFVHTLGTEYLGINGLFNNIISMLSVAELGLGSAIIFHLYKPIAEENIDKIKSLMQFYKIGYRIIATIIFLLGILAIPFLKYIVGNVVLNVNITYVFFLFLLDVTISYLLTYKRSILLANQKAYIINIVHIGYLLIMNFLQVIVLLLNKDYILYLWIKIVSRLVENIVINAIANKMYPYIKEKNIIQLDNKVKKGILKKVKGLIFHKVSSFIVTGTDNIIISSFLGVSVVGLYSNYNLIIQALNTFATQIFSSITASIGNLLVENDYNKNYKTYKKIVFFNLWICTFASSGLVCAMEPFICLWIGNEFLLPSSILLILIINFYIQGMRKTCVNFKEAAGIYYEDRYVPIIESIVNVVASIILVKFLGLSGVFIGTILSSLVIYLYSYPKFVYIPLFKKKYSDYYKEYIVYFLITIISIVPAYFICKVIMLESFIMQLIINIFIAVIVTNLIFMLSTFKTDEFKYYVELIKKITNKIHIFK